jgi:hypothetical protein
MHPDRLLYRGNGCLAILQSTQIKLEGALYFLFVFVRRAFKLGKLNYYNWDRDAYLRCFTDC